MDTSAVEWGARGRRFESSRPDLKYELLICNPTILKYFSNRKFFNYPGIFSVIHRISKTNAESWLSISAGIFYVSGSLYAYDEYAKKPNFLISKDKNDFDTWKNAELGIAAASYVINIISSIVVGGQHKMRSRTTLEITSRSLDHINNYYGNGGSNNVRLSARINF